VVSVLLPLIPSLLLALSCAGKPTHDEGATGLEAATPHQSNNGALGGDLGDEINTIVLDRCDEALSALLEQVSTALFVLALVVPLVLGFLRPNWRWYLSIFRRCLYPTLVLLVVAVVAWLILAIPSRLRLLLPVPGCDLRYYYEHLGTEFTRAGIGWFGAGAAVGQQVFLILGTLVVPVALGFLTALSLYRLSRLPALGWTLEGKSRRWGKD
jgi:hypothetical protein